MSAHAVADAMRHILSRIDRRCSAGVCSLLFAALLLPGCSPATRRTPTNVVLVSVDTLRPDRLGCYGATQVETPAIDALAASGVRFTQDRKSVV